MTEKLVTLTLSDVLYQRAQRLAAESAQPLETILTNRLEIALGELAGLPLDEQTELAALPHLSDDAL